MHLSFKIILLPFFISGCQYLAPASTEINEKEKQVYSYDDKVFASKALTQSYLKNKLVKMLTGTVNSQKLVKELFYANYKHKDLLKNIVADTTYKIGGKTIFEIINTDNDVLALKQPDSTMAFIINYINPDQVPAVPTNIIYVSPEDTPPRAVHNGSSWANAYSSLQEALLAQTSDSENIKNIWVANGTYKPSASDQAASFVLKPYVNIYGGFSGSETQLAGRILTGVNETILSGDLNNSGTANVGDSYHVVRGASNCTIDGFTISFGYAFGGGDEGNSGGGLYNGNASPTVSKVRFINNKADWYGAGIYNSNSSPNVSNSIFTLNETYNGAGMFSVGSSNPTITNSTFSGNIGPHGRGLSSYGGVTTIRNSIIWPDVIRNDAGGSSYIRNSIYTDTWGTSTDQGGNITTTTDPLFVSATDFRLLFGSPARNTGTNNSVAQGVTGIPTTDIIGLTRPKGAITDMGAYEFNE